MLIRGGLLTIFRSNIGAYSRGLFRGGAVRGFMVILFIFIKNNLSSFFNFYILFINFINLQFNGYSFLVFQCDIWALWVMNNYNLPMTS